jgi:hypothetical protein
MRFDGVSPDAEEVRLRRDGFLPIVDPCAPGLIAAMGAKFRAAIEDEELSQRRASAAARHKGQFYSRLLKNPDILLPELAETIDDNLMKVLAAHYGPCFAVRDFIAWRNYCPPLEVRQDVEVYSDRWHCDRIPGGVLKYFVLLNDVDEARGPMLVQNRRRTRQLLRLGFQERDHYGLDTRIVDDPAHIFRFTGEAGARVLCSTVRCLHRASYPAPGEVRDILQIQFEPAYKPFDRAALGPAIRVRTTEMTMPCSDASDVE